MIEKNRKHTSTVRLLKKSLQTFFQNLPTDFFAVEGIKVLIKGRFNKRRRTKTIVIQEGQISLQTIKTPIDYYQTQAITLYGAFGIKVWLAKKL
jgi:ribosomal protein S3